MWQSLVDSIHNLIPWFDGGLADVIIILIKGLALIFPLIIAMAYMTYAAKLLVSCSLELVQIGLGHWGYCNHLLTFLK
jgi:hypothetical protein